MRPDAIPNDRYLNLPYTSNIIVVITGIIIIFFYFVSGNISL